MSLKSHTKKIYINIDLVKGKSLLRRLNERQNLR